MIRLRATWHIPGGGSAAAADALFRESHAPAVQRLPGLARHEVLRSLPNAQGGNPAWWRGEHLDFPDDNALTAAETSPEWPLCWGGDFAAVVAGLRIDVFDVIEEFSPAASGEPSAHGPVTALSGIWQVPARLTPDEVDPVYLDVHVPNVRRLPRLQRHTIMRSRDWPAGHYARSWRSAEIRFACEDDFRAVFHSPAYETIRQDGFNASIVGPDVDIYVIEDAWDR